eukprot:1177084-Pleurochrysis_carterae.AAC.2
MFKAQPLMVDMTCMHMKGWVHALLTFQSQESARPAHCFELARPLRTLQPQPKRTEQKIDVDKNG